MNCNAVARSFGQAADTYDQYAHLQAKAADDLLTLLSAEQKPGLALDLGCATASMANKLSECHVGPWLGVDIAWPMLNKARVLQRDGPCYRLINADAHQLPLTDNSLSLIFSSFALQWCDDQASLIDELCRVLSPGGTLLIAVPVAGTLYELQQSWAQVDDQRHVNTLASAEQWQQTMTQAGLKDKDSHCRQFREYYPSLNHVHRMLKATGAHHVKQRQTPGLLSPTRQRALQTAYQHFADEQGLPVTWQVLFMHYLLPMNANGVDQQ